MVRGVIPNNSIPDINFAVSASAGRKLSLPVDPASLIYSHFKNVAGVPAPEGSGGVTISKLNILDVLIEQMNKLRTNPALPPSNNNNAMARLNAINEAYRKEFQQAKAASNVMPYIPAPQSPAGALLRINA